MGFFKSKKFKLAAALLGAATGAPNHYSLSKDVTGARGSLKKPGYSVDKLKEKKFGDAADNAAAQQQAAAAAAAEEEKAFDLQKESQKKGLLRKGRRASILTSSQGVEDQLGILG